jgi:hypothetical protein
MSFVETLYKRFITYVDNATRDPKAEAEERKRIKALKDAQGRASKILAAEKALLQKAQNTQSPGRKEEAMRYSIFPEDAKELQTFLDNATSSVNNAVHGEDVDDFMKEHFNEDYENYKVNCIFNTAVYPKAVGARVGLWMIIRAIKQLMHDNEELTTSEISLLKMIQDDVKKILDDAKYKKVGEWQPIAVEDLKNLDNYKKILQTSPDKVDKNSQEYKNIMLLAPKIYPTVIKLLKNHGEVDFQDKEGDAFTGNITDETQKAKAVKLDKTNDNFDLGSLILKTISYMLTVLFFLLIIFFLSLGSSMAVNLNVHKPLAYKIFYMIYGFLFGLIVVPYVLLYRWFWLKKKPEYYSFIPLIPRFFVNPHIQFLLGWLTYKPINTIVKLEEWRHPPPVTPTII